MFNLLRPKRYSFVVTLALLLAGIASGFLWSWVFGQNANPAFATGNDLPGPGAIIVLAIGGIGLMRRPPKGAR